MCRPVAVTAPENLVEISKSTEPETGFPTLSRRMCTQMIAFAVEPSVTAGTSFAACITARNARVVDFWAIRPNELNSNRPVQINVFFMADLSPNSNSQHTIRVRLPMHESKEVATCYGNILKVNTRLR